MAPSTYTVDLTTSVGGVPLTSCVYNASGPRSGTSAALSKIAQHSESGAVLSKSATLLPQKGNPQPRTYHAPDGTASFNSEGLPNSGIDYYLSEETINEIYGGDGGNKSNKPYIVSLSGKTLDDNVAMLERIANSPALDRIAGIELNLACPNVIGKPIIAYDFDQMDSILKRIGEVCTNAGGEKKMPPLGVKLPPYLDFQHFAAAARVLNDHKNSVKYVASINTIGNALVVDAESEAPFISSNSGFAGLSGPAVKYTALANVRKLRELLDDSIDVVGVGGIKTGRDAFEMLLCGACAVQVATCHWIEGPKCFDRICSELRDIMRDKGYKSLEDFRGKLKDWSREGADASRRKSKEAASKGGGGEASSSSSDAQFYKILSGVLAVLLAVVCAAKLQ